MSLRQEFLCLDTDFDPTVYAYQPATRAAQSVPLEDLALKRRVAFADRSLALNRTYKLGIVYDCVLIDVKNVLLHGHNF